MKKAFFEYHIRDERNFSKLLNDALIILDTNSILNLYRYNNENREKFFEILESVEDRLVMPYQVAYEFYENREKIIQSKASFKKNITEFLNTQLSKISNNIRESNSNDNYNSSVSLLKYEDPLRKELVQKFDLFNKDIIKVIEDYESDISSEYIFTNDKILDDVNKLYNERISKAFSIEELEKIYVEGKDRYEKKTPPGYKDCNKPEPKRYGDLVIWKEMIKISKDKNKSVLFISDDRKEDWCYKFEGKDLGSRRELIREFYDETNKVFYSLTTSDFIKKISDLNSIVEIESLERETVILEEELRREDEYLRKRNSPRMLLNQISQCEECPDKEGCDLLDEYKRDIKKLLKDGNLDITYQHKLLRYLKYDRQFN
jgi:predicted nucleic acid-binding protein